MRLAGPCCLPGTGLSHHHKLHPGPQTPWWDILLGQSLPWERGWGGAGCAPHFREHQWFPKLFFWQESSFPSETWCFEAVLFPYSPQAWGRFEDVRGLRNSFCFCASSGHWGWPLFSPWGGVQAWGHQNHWAKPLLFLRTFVSPHFLYLECQKDIGRGQGALCIQQCSVTTVIVCEMKTAPYHSRAPRIPAVPQLAPGHP